MFTSIILVLMVKKGQTLPYMFYCICLPHIIFHRNNSAASRPHCISQHLNQHHSTGHATQSKVNPVQDFYTLYTFYTAIIISLIAACAARPPYHAARSVIAPYHADGGGTPSLPYLSVRRGIRLRRRRQVARRAQRGALRSKVARGRATDPLKFTFIRLQATSQFCKFC